jgi:hypothetical protein
MMDAAKPSSPNSEVVSSPSTSGKSGVAADMIATPAGPSAKAGDANAQPSQATPQVSILFEPTQFVEQEESVIARTPLKAKDEKTAAVLTVALRAVLFDGGHAAPDRETFSATLVSGKQPKELDLVVTAPASKAPPGDYKLYLALRSSASESVQDLTLAVKRVAATVSATRKVAVWQKPSLWPSSQAAGLLELQEDGGKTAARGITFNDVRDLTASGDSESAILQISGPQKIEPGKSARYGVTTHGEFPVGMTTGKIIVRSDNLAAPVQVDYTVYIRRSLVFIAICAIAGIALGWLVRIRLPAMQARDQSAAEASKIMAALNDAAAKIPDLQFRNEIAVAADALRKGAASSDSKTITDASAAARQALVTAEKNLADRQKVVADALIPLHELLDQSWNLPKAVNAQLEAARRAANKALELLNARDVAAADDLDKHELQHELKTLANMASAWRKNAGLYLKALIDDRPSVSDDGDKQVEEASAEWEKQFSVTHTSINREQLSAELADTHSAYHQAKDIARILGILGLRIANWAKDQFAPLAPADAFKTLAGLIGNHADAIRVDLESPEDAFERPQQRLREQKKAWLAALKSAVPSTVEFPNAAITDIEKGLWTAAVEKTWSAIQTQKRGTVSREIMSMNALNEAPPVIQQPQPALVPRGLTAMLQPIGAITGTLPERIHFTEHAKMAAFIQSLFGLILFVAAAYALLAEKWIGTGTEMFVVFAWAFCLDLSTEALVTLLKRFIPTSLA